MLSVRIQRQIERLLDEAEAAVVERNWQLVRERVAHVLELDPDNVDAQAPAQNKPCNCVVQSTLNSTPPIM